VFRWLTERRRKRLLEEPFPDTWLAHLEDNVAAYALLVDDERKRLRDLVQVFIAEKHWEGCGGLELTDEMRVTIAGSACLLILGRDHDLMREVESILVYPSTVMLPEQPRGFFDGRPIVNDGPTAVHGVAHGGGPVVLAWDDVLAGGRGQGRRNVVFHEFAHKIDMHDGTIDGTPPLDSSAARRAWAEICSKAYLELRERVDAGKKTFLDDYGATNEAEFFAVATETYFIRPEKLRAEEPELFAILADFYRFEPPPR